MQTQLQSQLLRSSMLSDHLIANLTQDVASNNADSRGGGRQQWKPKGEVRNHI